MNIFLKNLAEKPSKKPDPIKLARRLYPVLNASTLLSHPKRRLLLQKIRENSGLEGERYETYYADLIRNFVEFVQILPLTPGGKLGGLMDNGLERAALAIELYRQEENGRKDPLFTYALFSAILLQDVGRVLTQQKIIISDIKGAGIEEWIPLQGSLVGKADYYKARLLGGSWVSLGHLVTTTLARQLMPEVGYLWICENYWIYQMWLAILSRDDASGGTVMHWLTLVDERYKLRTEKDQLPPVDVEEIETDELTAGEDFLEWLITGLADGSITTNQPGSRVHVLDGGGVFIEHPEIFKDFSDANPQYKNWQEVFNQFQRLMQTQQIGKTEKIHEFFVKSEVKKTTPFLFGQGQPLKQAGAAPRVHSFQGLIISELRLLFFGNKPPEANHSIEAVDREHRSLKQLDKLEEPGHPPVPPGVGMDKS